MVFWQKTVVVQVPVRLHGCRVSLMLRCGLKLFGRLMSLSYNSTRAGWVSSLLRILINSENLCSFLLCCSGSRPSFSTASLTPLVPLIPAMILTAWFWTCSKLTISLLLLVSLAAYYCDCCWFIIIILLLNLLWWYEIINYLYIFVIIITIIIVVVITIIIVSLWFNIIYLKQSWVVFFVIDIFTLCLQ